jgi:cytochrome c2
MPFLAALSLSFITYSCVQTPKSKLQEIRGDDIDSSSKKIEYYIDLEKILGKRNGTNALTVQVKYDHFFRTHKKYKGYYINPILDSVIKSVDFDTSNAIVVFECADGYKPVMDLSKIFGDTRGYIVFRDLDKNVGKNWPDSVYEKFKPYYLVWDDAKKEDNSFMWPYGLIGLRLISSGREYKAIYPFENVSLVKGFTLFRDNCMKCHSINKIGGTQGPEFNFPENITEYWKEEDIISFAKNPKAYRYNSHMPPVTNVQDSEFKQIVQYIKYMKNNKLHD